MSDIRTEQEKRDYQTRYALYARFGVLRKRDVDFIADTEERQEFIDSLQRIHEMIKELDKE